MPQTMFPYYRQRPASNNNYKVMFPCYRQHHASNNYHKLMYPCYSYAANNNYKLMFPCYRQRLRQPNPPGAPLLPLRKGENLQLQGLTPGQQSRQFLALRAMNNPHSQANRTVLSDNFGIQLPLIPQTKEKKVTN